MYGEGIIVSFMVTILSGFVDKQQQIIYYLIANVG